MHKARKAAAAAADSGRTIRRPRRRVSPVRDVPRLGGGDRATSRKRFVVGRGGGARQVEHANSVQVMDRDMRVLIRRLWWRAAERPDNILHSVRRSLHTVRSQQKLARPAQAK